MTYIPSADVGQTPELIDSEVVFDKRQLAGLISISYTVGNGNSADTWYTLS